eukprot:Skav225627  [mRNA]  locus=scaffold1513:47341:54762:+ [translate_table: standard]
MARGLSQWITTIKSGERTAGHAAPGGLPKALQPKPAALRCERRTQGAVVMPPDPVQAIRQGLLGPRGPHELWNDSEEEEAIFEDILSQRPDVADMVSYKDPAGLAAMSRPKPAAQENESFMEERLEQDIQSFEAKMQQAYPSWEFYQGRINALKETRRDAKCEWLTHKDGVTDGSSW